jgi:hypothetical protein
VALAEPLVAVRGEHEGITALCSQCGTTLGTLLREKPRALDWNGAGLAELHASALCSLIGSGALASVTELVLGDNQIGDVGMQAFSTALAGGALASLTRLYLDNNQIGDKGLEAFSGALATGALASVTDLRLWGNQIEDEGMKAFSAALATGALASIRFIDLDYNQATEMGKTAMRDVAETRSFQVYLSAFHTCQAG